MKAVVRRSSRLVLDDVPDPVPIPGTVLTKTLACGICGSDLHALTHMDRMVEGAVRSGSPFKLDPSRDVVMGHEFAAEILEYGEGSSRPYPTGTRVCAMPLTLDVSGIATVGYSNEFPGGYGERMLLQEMLLLPIPNGLASHHAALTEPMAVGVHAVDSLSSHRLYELTSIRGTYVFAELQYQKVDGFGQAGFDLSDKTWNVGLYLEI